MRSVLAWVAVFVLLGSLPSSATERIDFDGVWWQSLSPHEKTIAVEGFIVGYSGAYSDAVNATCLSADVATMRRVPACRKAPNPHILDLTFGEMSRRIDKRFATKQYARSMLAPHLFCVLTQPDNCGDLP